MRMEPEGDFRPILRMIESDIGIQSSNYKEDYLKRRVQSRMRMTGVRTYRDYLLLLRCNPPEQEALKNGLTINVTKFWRDPPVFDAIRRDIIPELRRRKKTIRIWSAGCATGEEPYTLAIIAHEASIMNKDLKFIIFASDIDEEALMKAKEGAYHKKALENLSDAQVRRHFTERTDGKFEVKHHLREYVRFSRHDLMSGIPATSHLDMVLCRNVTIYFTEHQKDELARMVAPALTAGGYYVIGKTEYLSRDFERLYEPVNQMQKIYRKKV